MFLSLSAVASETTFEGLRPVQVLEALQELQRGPSNTDCEETSSRGAVFRQTVKHPQLGSKVWVDPSGVAWGEVVLNSVENRESCSKKSSIDGVCLMYPRDAARYCKDLGARLPNGHDYLRLREYFGGSILSEQGYFPQILSGLYHESEGSRFENVFWIEPTRVPTRRGNNFKACRFFGVSGRIHYQDMCTGGDLAVRCVIDSEK